MVGVKTMLDSRKANELSNGILAVYSALGIPNARLDVTQLNKYFAPTIEIISNDNKVVKNLQQFQERIKNIQQRFPSITYSRLLEEPVVAHNRIVIRYNAELTAANGKKQHASIIAILTVEEERVTHWTEVIHEHIEK